jgi:hypothetical protein
VQTESICNQNYFSELAIVCDELKAQIPLDPILSQFIPSASGVVSMNYEHFSKKIYVLMSVFVDITGKGTVRPSQFAFDILKLDYKNEKVIQEGYDNNQFSAEIAEGFQLGKSSPFVTPSSSIKSAVNVELELSSKNNTAGSGATIVFCEMKITAVALNDLLRSVTDYWKEKLPLETTEFPLRSDSILGTDSLDKQRKALKSLKTGSLNLLFATDVAQEGLDIPHCNLIVNFNGPKTLIGFIQRRGRARSENSLLISLVNEFRDEAEDFEFRDFKKFLKEENETSNHLKSFQDGIGLIPDEFDNEEKRFIIPSTGAHIDIIKAKSVLQEYCDYIYRLELESENEKDQSHDEIYYSPRSFFDGGKQGKLLLPETVRKRLKLESVKDFPPFVVVGGKKVEAQGKLALQAIKYLHGKGEFDAHLSFRDAITPLDSKHSSVTKTPKKPVQERMISLRVKKACDQIVSQSNSSNLFYFYSVELNGVPPEFHHSTTKILSQLDSLKSIVYGFCFELPDVVLASAFTCQLKSLPWNSMSFRLKFVGKRVLTSDELRNIQVWMKTVNGLHSFKLDDFTGFKTLNDFTKNHLEAIPVYSFEEWKSKSDSSYFISFPIPPTDDNVQDINNIHSTFFQDIALQGLHYSYNLSVIQINNELNRKTSFYHSSKDSMKDQIVTTDGKNMFCFETNDLLVSSADFQASLKGLSSIMDPRQKNNSRTFFQHFSNKYSSKHNGFAAFLQTINQQENYKLTRGYPLTGIMSFIPLFPSANLHDQDSQGTATENDFIPECCYPVGSLSFYNLSLLLPTLTFRVQSVLLASELWTKLFNNTEISKERSLNNLLTAMTPRRQGENINSER